MIDVRNGDLGLQTLSLISASGPGAGPTLLPFPKK
jgi:hypothetical protein